MRQGWKEPRNARKGSSSSLRRGIFFLEMRESVKASIALDATIGPHVKGRQDISLDEATPMRATNLQAGAMWARTLEAIVHFCLIV
jgi:hypothetical protein